MDNVTVKVDLGDLLADLRAMGAGVDDLKAGFSDIAKKGADLAASFAPRRTGRLQGSIRGNRSKRKAVISAGGARVPWAPPINWGWPDRGIAASLFMQKADRELGPLAPKMLEDNVKALIRSRGMQ